MSEINQPEWAKRKLLARIRKEGNGCWIWIGCCNGNGYGYIWWDAYNWPTHRLAHELFIGPIPEGFSVLHKCDNPPCCNPEHLFADTPQANVDDMIAKGRARLTGRPRGLSDEDIEAVLKELSPSMTNGEIAERCRVSKGIVSRIRNGKLRPKRPGWRRY
jgi:hypothetical protein